jgi:hypothetical protein
MRSSGGDGSGSGAEARPALVRRDGYHDGVQAGERG